MKIPPFFLFAFAWVTVLPAKAQDQNFAGMDIGVRSGIDRAEKRKRGRNEIYARDLSQHANVFLLAAVLPHPSLATLVSPVDAVAIAKELSLKLEENGFHAVRPDQKPQIVITVEYGRGYLPNPYSDGDLDKMHNDLSNADPVMPPWHLHYIFFSASNEMKRQRADEEKLIIEVRAWAYPPPPDPEEEPKLLWMTSMAVDDPDRRDLNDIYKKMLAAGAPHFGKHIDRQHPVVIKQVPEGKVKVGTPEVVNDHEVR